MDIDLTSEKEISWEQDKCPWNEADETDKHKCAIKNISICKFFKGVEKLDTVLCRYGDEI